MSKLRIILMASAFGLLSSVVLYMATAPVYGCCSRIGEVTIDAGDINLLTGEIRPPVTSFINGNAPAITTVRESQNPYPFIPFPVGFGIGFLPVVVFAVALGGFRPKHMRGQTLAT